MHLSRRHGVSLLFALVIATCSVGCAVNRVQAPFDSFVCYNSTFNECLGRAQSGRLRTLQMSAFRNLAVGSFAAGSNSAVVEDPEAGQTLSSGDTKYQCSYGNIPYAQTLDPDRRAAAVFVSPVLLRQIGEQQLRLTRARTSCARLLQAYEFQVTIIARQDELAVAQKATAVLSSEVESERAAKDAVGARGLNATEQAQFGLGAIAVRDALKLSRENVVSIGETLRTMYRTQVLDVDFKRQFEDANLAIELQLRELARNLFVLDRSIAPDATRRLLPVGYADGAWVEQGTVVLTTKQLERF